jgi:poly-gamma-glutamate capsule biosynthesis protein CapA/YwtB (metallophosphatase superfamily)
MGDETKEFASLYSNAVRDLALLAGEDTHAAFEKAHGARLAGAVREALDAVASVFETGTDALKDWPKKRLRVLARIAAMREALDRSGVDEDLRRRAGELVALVGPEPARE